MRYIRFRAILLFVAVVLAPLTLGQSCWVPAPIGGGSQGSSLDGNTFQLTLYQDDDIVDQFSLTSGQVNLTIGELTLSEGDTTQTTYRLSVIHLVADGSNTIRVVFNDPAGVSPVVAAQFDGELYLEHRTSLSVTAEGNLVSSPSGEVNLTRSGSRLTGDFDVTIGRLRAVATVDLPETFHVNTMG